MAWMRTSTTTPPPTFTPAWSILVTTAPVGTTTSENDASRGSGRHGSTRHEHIPLAQASCQAEERMKGWKRGAWASGETGWKDCFYVTCTPMGGGDWEERQGGWLLWGSQALLGRWTTLGEPGGNLRWTWLCTVFSNYIRFDFCVGYQSFPVLISKVQSLLSVTPPCADTFVVPKDPCSVPVVDVHCSFPLWRALCTPFNAMSWR